MEWDIATSLELRDEAHLQRNGVEQMMKVHQVDNDSTPKKVVNGCQRSEELSCHDTSTRHPGGGVIRRYIPLSGKRITFDSEIIETL